MGAPENKPIAAIVQRIAKECEEAGCSAWTVTKVIKEISLLENAGERHLRKRALELMQKLDPAAAKVYASFQRLLVRTSRQTIEPFDRGNIIGSLLKETDVTRGVAEKIGHDVEDQIKDLGIGRVSTALIREMANVKLLEYGHESIRNQYTRLGMPVFNVKREIQQRPTASRAIMAEYNLLRVIPRKLGEMHLRSDIFIASLECFSTKPLAYCHRFYPAKSLNETVFTNLKRMNQLSRFVAWPVNASNVNIALLPFVGKRSVGKAVGLFLNAFETVFCRRTAVSRNIGLHLFPPENIGENIERELVVSSVKAFLQHAEELHKTNNRIVLAFDTKYRLKLLSKSSLENIALLNCRDGPLFPLNGIAAKGNICSLFGLNLPKAASSGSEQKFFERTSGCLEAIKELAELKKDILAKRGYLRENGIEAKKMLDAVALFGLFSAAAEITHGNDKETIQFAEKTVSHIAGELNKRFVLTDLLNKGGAKRFEAENKKMKTPPHEEDLSKSTAIHKAMRVCIKARSRGEMNSLIDGNIAMIEMA
jgi:hypothetical protein